MMKAAKIIIFIFIIISVIVVGDNIILADDYCAYAQMQNENDASARTINNFSDLAAIASDVNGGKYDGYYGLTINLACDLDIGDDCRSFDSGSGWIPIGTTTYPFKGTFNGNGYSISGLYINSWIIRCCKCKRYNREFGSRWYDCWQQLYRRIDRI